MSHVRYGLDMRAGLWRAHCGCGWQSVPSPDVGAETAHLDEHLRAVVARDQRRTVRVVADPFALRRSARSVLVGAVALGLAAVAALAAWVDHDVDGV